MARSDQPRTVRFDLRDTPKHDTETSEDVVEQVLAPSFQFGSRVRIVGLVNQPALNHAEGIVLGLNANGRCEVKVCSPTHLADAFQQGIFIYPANLEPLPDQRPAQHPDTHQPPDAQTQQRDKARRRMATNMVDSLFRALALDEFPDQPVERYFGIARPPRCRSCLDLSQRPVSHLTYATWQALYQAKLDLIMRADPDFKEEHIPMNRFPWMPGHDLYLKAEQVFKHEVVNALLVPGGLLGWFMQQVEALNNPQGFECSPTHAPWGVPGGRVSIQVDMAGGGPATVEYLKEMCRRGFEGVVMEPLPL